VVKLAYYQLSWFSVGLNLLPQSSFGQNRNRNQTGNVDLLLTLELYSSHPINIICIWLVVNTHNMNCFVMQDVHGVILNVNNPSKLTIEMLHQYGLSIVDDAVLKGIR
jgi:hypothetical protein